MSGVERPRLFRRSIPLRPGPVKLGIGPVKLGIGPVKLGIGPVKLGIGPVRPEIGPVEFGPGAVKVRRAGPGPDESQPLGLEEATGTGLGRPGPAGQRTRR